jgi:bacillithiol biosynthesis cysteine-adding enzyme BshC
VSLRVETISSYPAPRFDFEEVAGRRSFTPDARLRTAFLARGAGEDNLGRLFEPGSLCVTTGQQPGLFTGPVYTLHKAMAAIAVARKLESLMGRPVVPVFWVAGDDHDFVESSSTSILTVANEIETLTLGERPTAAPQLPMYKQILGEGSAAALTALAGATPDTEFKRSVLDCVARHYRPDNDVASAFAGMLAELLGRFGLVVFQPYHEAAKIAAAPVTVQALEAAASINSSLSRRVADLSEAGQPTPIKVDAQATTVMLEAGMGRDRLILAEGSFETRRSGERWTLAQLATIAQDEPHRLSPNVLLRPVVEAAMLPTLAYVAGPGELAYLPQADPLYARLGIEPQHKVARWGGTILERRVQKVLDKFGIAADDLAASEGQLEARLAREEMPGEIASALVELRRALSEQYGLLAAAAARLDPTLEKPVRSEGHTAMRRLGEVEKKIVGQLKRRNATVAEQLAKARTNLFPLGQPQERVLNALPYLIRYGDEFLDTILERCTEWAVALETAPGDT